MVTTASIFLTTTVVFNVSVPDSEAHRLTGRWVCLQAYWQKKQFYPSVVYLTKSNASLAVLYLQAFVSPSPHWNDILTLMLLTTGPGSTGREVGPKGVLRSAANH